MVETGRNSDKGGRSRKGLLTLQVAPAGAPFLFATEGAAMHCFVYASQRKPDTYLWLGRRDDFECIPESLSLLLGDLRYVLEVELTGERKLPHEDAAQVLQHIEEQGWHLQLPPNETLAAANHPAYKHAPRDPHNEH
jgi:uncharacterized protein YcgL (UPF0745 family)